MVIPANNESRVIGRTLGTLLDGASPGELEVVVACNACTDRTADIARSFDGVVVLEIPEAGKPGALNAADAVATVFPRVYLDADVEVSADSLRAAVEVLEAGPALASAPGLVVRMSGASRLVRAYYRAWLTLAYTNRDLIGAGFYALTEAGHRRIRPFPPIIADDLYVRSMFAPGERTSVGSGRFVVRPPLDLRSLVDVKVRRAVGNRQMRAMVEVLHPPRRERGDLLRSVRRQPRLAPCAVVYGAVQVACGLAARRRMRRHDMRWSRDLSSRS